MLWWSFIDHICHSSFSLSSNNSLNLVHSGSYIWTDPLFFSSIVLVRALIFTHPDYCRSAQYLSRLPLLSDINSALVRTFSTANTAVTNYVYEISNNNNKNNLLNQRIELTLNLARDRGSNDALVILSILQPCLPHHWPPTGRFWPQSDKDGQGA